MVCLGNICRSPIAEGVLAKKVQERGLNWQVDSAGTNGYHTGEPPHHFSQKVCAANGIDIAHQRSVRFRASDLERYDIIYAMAADVQEEIRRISGRQAAMSKVKLFLSELEEGSTASVPDPWYGDESGYLPVYELIEKTCEAIVIRYAGSR